MHFIPIAFAAITAPAGIVMDAYNPLPLGIGCWVAAYPMGCDAEGITIECTRGENARILIWFFGAIVILFAYFVLIICMIIIYVSVRNQLKKMERYGSSSLEFTNDQSAGGTGVRSSSQISKDRLRQVSTQGLLYICSMFLTYIWSSLTRALEFGGYTSEHFALSFLSQVFYPLQGFFNFMIFIRPRYMTSRRQNQKLTRMAVLKIIFGLKSLKKTHLIVSGQCSKTDHTMRSQSASRDLSQPFQTKRSDESSEMIKQPIYPNMSSDHNLGVLVSKNPSSDIDQSATIERDERNLGGYRTFGFNEYEKFQQPLEPSKNHTIDICNKRKDTNLASSILYDTSLNELINSVVDSIQPDQGDNYKTDPTIDTFLTRPFDLEQQSDVYEIEEISFSSSDDVAKVNDDE